MDIDYLEYNNEWNDDLIKLIRKHNLNNIIGAPTGILVCAVNSCLTTYSLIIDENRGTKLLNSDN